MDRFFVFLSDTSNLGPFELARLLKYLAIYCKLLVDLTSQEVAMSESYLHSIVSVLNAT